MGGVSFHYAQQRTPGVSRGYGYRQTGENVTGAPLVPD